MKQKKFIPDKIGYYLIRIRKNMIEAGLFSYKRELIKLYKAKRAKTISEKIMSDNNVIRIEHAIYLGRELQKAQFALEHKKKYVQDSELK